MYDSILSGFVQNVGIVKNQIKGGVNRCLARERNVLGFSLFYWFGCTFCLDRLPTSSCSFSWTKVTDFDVFSFNLTVEIPLVVQGYHQNGQEILRSESFQVLHRLLKKLNQKIPILPC